MADKLASCWLDFIDGLENRHPRTRVVVTDEGGIGKTLSVSVAVRWITLRENAEGPILVLVPPLLTEHWASHLRAVFPMILTALMSCQVLDSLILNFTKKTSLLSLNFLGFIICKIDKLCQTHLCVVIDGGSSRSHRNGLQ